MYLLFFSNKSQSTHQDLQPFPSDIRTSYSFSSSFIYKMKVECFLLLVLLLVLIVETTANVVCPTRCRFRLCNVGNRKPVPRTRRITLRAPGIAPNGPVVCRKSLRDKVGYVVTTGEPVAYPKNGPPTPLKMYAPAGLSPLFEEKFFGLDNVPVFGRSSITRKMYQGTQAEFLNNSLCISIPITSYEVRNKKTRELKRIMTRPRARPRRDCVTFVPITVPLFIELEWDGRDDLDLSLTEPGPNGEFVNKNNEISTNGGSFQLDVNFGGCISRKQLSGKERISYATTFPVGTYGIVVQHFSNCGDGPTNWRLRVTLGNDLILDEEGSDNGMFSSIVAETTFDIPPGASPDASPEF